MSFNGVSIEYRETHSHEKQKVKTRPVGQWGNTKLFCAAQQCTEVLSGCMVGSLNHFDHYLGDGKYLAAV